MALDAGVMSVCLEYANGLKDGDWFGKQDPYCNIRVGGQTFRTRTAVDGGRNPVWNETFIFNVLNENNAEIEVKDSDVGRDDVLGTATLSFARARQTGSDRIQVPVIRRKSRKQQGFITISLTWAPNKPHYQQASAAAHLPPYALAYYPQYPQAPAPSPYMAQSPYYPLAPTPTAPPRQPAAATAAGSYTQGQYYQQPGRYAPPPAPSVGTYQPTILVNSR